MSSAYEFVIRLRDEASTTLRSVGTGLDSMHGKLMNTKVSWNQLGQQMIVFNQAAQAVQQANNALEGLTRPGVAFQSSMADLKAITGLADDQVQELGKSARQLAKDFGTDASKGVESYKLLLSQLGPELAQSPEILDRMARSASHLSKTMGGDTTAATQVLTTAMNQFQVDLQNPIRAAAEMERMMNAMSAAAQQGSAELPAIQMALQQAGLAAKTANVSFEETNAAIQVLDKAGKKGSEGGVALRNVMSTLGQGRFLPKQVIDELEAAGVNVEHLGDQSLTLADRLRPLQGLLDDSALMSKLFGRENYASAVALISNIEAIEDLTEKITGTNTTFEQSAVIMDTHAERMNRLKARFQDFGVTAFSLTRRVLPVTAALGQTATLATQLLPAMSLARAGFITAYQGAMRLVAGLRAITVAKLAANAAWLVSPMGLVTMGIMAAAGAYLLLRRRIDDTTAAQKALNGVKKNAEQAIVGQRVEVERLTGVMQNENTTLGQKRAAYDRLIEIAPEYFGKLSFEEAQTGKLIEVSEDYIKSLQKQAMIKAFDEEINAELERLAKDQIQGHSSQYRNLLSWLGGADGVTTGQQVQNELKALWQGATRFTNPSAILRELNQETAAANMERDRAATLARTQYLETHKQALLNEGASSPLPGGEPTTEPGETPGRRSGYEQFLNGQESPANEQSEQEISRGISSITSGGARATNININMGNLVESFTVHSQSVRESADEIHDMVIDALLRSINSANASAGSF